MRTIRNRLGTTFPLWQNSHKYVAFKSFVALILGIVQAYNFPTPLPLNLFAILLFILAILIHKKSIFLFFILGIVLTYSSLYSYHSRIDSLPLGQQHLEVSFYKPPKRIMRTITIQDVSAIIGNEQYCFAAKLLTPLEPGETRLVDATVKEVEPTMYPWEFSREDYFIQNAIHGELIETESLTRERSNFQNHLFHFLTNKIEQLPDNTQAFYKALILGDKSGFSSGMKFLFYEGGVSHLFAISGFHIGLLLLFLSIVLKPFPIHKSIKLLILIVIPWGIVFIVGSSASTVRALIMTSTLLTAKLIWKDVNPLNSLGIAGVIVLSINPLQLFTLGFQLSFSAVFAILFMYRVVLHQQYSVTVQRIMLSILTPFSVAVAIAPITILFLGTSTPLGALTNLLFIPVFTVVVTLTIPTLIALPSNELTTTFIDIITESLYEILQNITCFFNIQTIQSGDIFIPSLCITIVLFLIFSANKGNRKFIVFYSLLSYLTLATVLASIPQKTGSRLESVGTAISISQENGNSITLSIDSCNTNPQKMIQWISSNYRSNTLIIVSDRVYPEIIFYIYQSRSFNNVYLYGSENYLQYQMNIPNWHYVDENDTLFINGEYHR